MEVVYDTGSDWLTIEGRLCTKCGGNTFDQAGSSTFQFLESQQSTELAYGSASLKGLRASDKVCLPINSDQSEGACLSKFEFFYVSEQAGLTDRIDGVLGLSRSYLPPGLMADDWRGIGPLYVKELAEQGHIDKNIFAFYLESHASVSSSFLDIGAIEDSHMRKGETPVWFKLTPHMYWMVESVSGVRFAEAEAFTWLKG